MTSLRTRIGASIRFLLRRAGYDLRRLEMGQNAYCDIKQIIGHKSSPVLFDVGANVGQTIDILFNLFPDAMIHGFEPSSTAFRQLLHTHPKIPNLRLNNCALGADIGKRAFFENSLSVMSSFLPLGPDGWGQIVNQREMEIDTVDNYCIKNEIASIDLLKSDTQGFDLEVIRGARSLLERRSIHLLYLEINFSKIYLNGPRMDEIYGFISDYGFELVSFYKIEYQNQRSGLTDARFGRAGWTDALFVHPEYRY